MGAALHRRGEIGCGGHAVDAGREVLAEASELVSGQAKPRADVPEYPYQTVGSKIKQMKFHQESMRKVCLVQIKTPLFARLSPTSDEYLGGIILHHHENKPLTFSSRK
jgi:hypothetical protein